MASRLISVIFGVCLFGGVSCANSQQANGEPAYIAFSNFNPALVNYGAVDKSAVWTRNIISVCWLNHTEYKAERAWVSDSIAKTWESASSVRFVGWQDCDNAPSSDVKILIDESGPRSFIGMHAIGQTPSMWLNFTFNSWGQPCQQKREACIRAIAVHEFGHAAGFAHEQLNYSGTGPPQECINFLKANGEWENLDKNIVALTPYDADSAMNYCNAIWNNNGNLSKNDKLAIKILFPG